MALELEVERQEDGLEVRQLFAKDEQPHVHQVRHETMVGHCADALVERVEAGKEERLEIVCYQIRLTFKDAALDLNCDEAVQIFDGGAQLFPFECSKQLCPQKCPDVFRAHIVQPKALKVCSCGDVNRV